jgi:NCS1 family nucleobase:cation symporter-1
LRRTILASSLKQVKTCTRWVGSTVYYVCIKVRKPQVYPTGFQEVPVSWEYLCKEGRDGVFDGERDAYGMSPSGSVAEQVDVVEEKPKASN